ncbi:hypothetical protein Hanom_Chr15g01401431 [Helianthus anomalus]
MPRRIDDFKNSKASKKRSITLRGNKRPTRERERGANEKMNISGLNHKACMQRHLRTSLIQLTLGDMMKWVKNLREAGMLTQSQSCHESGRNTNFPYQHSVQYNHSSNKPLGISKSKCSHKEKTRGKNLNSHKFQLLLLAFAILLGSNEVTDDLHC